MGPTRLLQHAVMNSEGNPLGLGHYFVQTLDKFKRCEHQQKVVIVFIEKIVAKKKKNPV